MDLLYFLFVILLGSHVSLHKAQALRTEKILGGNIGRTGKFKYTVAVIYRAENLVDVSPCSASILSTRFVATVAHCFYDKSLGVLRSTFYYIAAGTVNLRERTSNTRYIPVDLVFFHKAYDPTKPDDHTSFGNIALVQLLESLDIGQNHPSLSELFIRSQYLKNLKLTYTVSGYGLSEVELCIEDKNNKIEYVQKGNPDGRVRFAKSKILPDDECQQIFQNNVAPGNMCVRMIKDPYDKNPMGICKGDQGGPLVHNGFLDGIAVSNFLECDEELTPAIYIDIIYYRKFIDDVMHNRLTLDMYTVKLVESPPNYFSFVEI